MVHLDATNEDEVRIAHAEAIGTMWDARVRYLYNLLPTMEWSRPAMPEALR